MLMKKTHLYIVHGYKARPDKHWFPWLINQLSNTDTRVKSLIMPNPASPVYDQWVTAIEEQIHGLDENTYFIGHSLGTITLLKYLSHSLQPKKIGGLVLVAPFDQKLPVHPELDTYIDHQIDYEVLVNHIKYRHVYASKDDTTVLPEFSEGVSYRLHATRHQLDGYGHFCECDGIKTFPAIETYIRQVI